MNEIKTTQKSNRPHLRMYLYLMRQEAGLTFDEITKALTLSKPYYYQLEQGRKGHRMDVVFLSHIADTLQVDFETLCQAELNYQKERRARGIRREQRWIVPDELVES